MKEVILKSSLHEVVSCHLPLPGGRFDTADETERFDTAACPLLLPGDDADLQRKPRTCGGEESTTFQCLFSNDEPQQDKTGRFL